MPAHLFLDALERCLAFHATGNAEAAFRGWTFAQPWGEGGHDRPGPTSDAIVRVPMAQGAVHITRAASDDGTAFLRCGLHETATRRTARYDAEFERLLRAGMAAGTLQPIQPGLRRSPHEAVRICVEGRPTAAIDLPPAVALDAVTFAVATDRPDGSGRIAPCTQIGG